MVGIVVVEEIVVVVDVVVEGVAVVVVVVGGAVGVGVVDVGGAVVEVDIVVGSGGMVGVHVGVQGDVPVVVVLASSSERTILVELCISS